MRSVLSAILIGLLATCPIVCGTADAHASEGGDAHGAAGQSDLPTPANDDDCLCNGALKTGDTATDLDFEAQSQPLDLALCGFALPTASLAPVALPARFAQIRTGDAAGGARCSILRC